ncbi:hypothetical protein LINPERHAP2_LOCUS244 [Linum perenne]
MIVNTLDRCFPFSFMSLKLPQLWAKKGIIIVSDVGFWFYVVRFETVADYERAMFGGPWMIFDHYVVIQKWRPHFRPEETVLSTLRVWVHLPGLPLEYFDNSILKFIGDRIGRTVRIDHTTLEGSRGNFARICVEVDLCKPLLSKYRMRRRVRRIEYEGLHTICFNCWCYDHKDESCKQTPESEVVENQTTVFANPVFLDANDVESRPEVEQDFGPWMQVKKHRRKTKQVAKSVDDPKESASPAASDGNGNRFSALKDMEGGANSGEISISQDAEPLEALIKEDLVGILPSSDKENVDPRLGGPDCFSLPHPASIHTILGLGPNIHIPQPPFFNSGNGDQPGPLSNSHLSSPSEVHEFLHESSLARSSSSPSNGVSNLGKQPVQVSSRGTIPPKGPKISKSKSKDSTATGVSKPREASQRNAPKNVASAMEEV